MIETHAYEHAIKLKKMFFLKRPYRIEITNVRSESFVNFIGINSTITTSGLSVYANVLETMQNPYVKMLIMLQSSSGKYDLTLVNTTVNVCEFFGNRKYLPTLQVFYRALTKTGTFPKKCPVVKVKMYSFFCDLKVFEKQNFIPFRDCMFLKTSSSTQKIFRLLFQALERILKGPL